MTRIHTQWQSYNNTTSLGMYPGEYRLLFPFSSERREYNLSQQQGTILPIFPKYPADCALLRESLDCHHYFRTPCGLTKSFWFPVYIHRPISTKTYFYADVKLKTEEGPKQVGVNDCSVFAIATATRWQSKGYYIRSAGCEAAFTQVFQKLLAQSIPYM